MIVPANNEEASIEQTVNSILEIAKDNDLGLQLILIDDGSADRTGELMEQVAAGVSSATVVHQPAVKGLTEAFREGTRRVSAPYLTLVPGNASYAEQGLRNFFESIGRAELVIGYRENQQQARTQTRFFLSFVFTCIVSILFGGRLRDYHGLVAYPVEKLKQISIRANGPAFQIEALVRVLRLRPSLAQVPVSLNRQTKTSSKSLRWKTFFQLARTMADLLIRR